MIQFQEVTAAYFSLIGGLYSCDFVGRCLVANEILKQESLFRSKRKKCVKSIFA